MRAWLSCGLTAALSLSAVVASAQPNGAPRPQSPASWEQLRPRGDLDVSLGWFNAKLGTASCCQWADSLWAGVEGGYYWTEHLKTEGGFAGTRQADASMETRTTVIDGWPYSEYGFDRVWTTRGWAVQVYQFGHNAWVHPFVGAGLAVVRERREGFRFGYPSSSHEPVQERLPITTETTASGLALAGLKLYASRRAFFRTDLVLGFQDGIEEVTARVGFGVDW